MGFYYNAGLFSHSFFKNKRKRFKNKKIDKLKSKKKKKENKTYFQKQLQVNNIRRYTKSNNKLILEAKKKAAKLNYLKKLNKIKAERKKRVDVKLNRDFKKAQQTH